VREKRKSKEKISGSGATVKGKWPYYDVMNSLEYCLQRRTTEMFQRQQVSVTDPDETEIGNSEQLERENIIHDQKMEGMSSKKEQSVGIKRGGKIQKLTVVDIGRQYLDCLREIGKELRRFWFRISVTILMEQKRHRLLYTHTHTYIYIYMTCIF